MPITFRCQSCNVKINAPDFAAGKPFKCPRCKDGLRVPDVAIVLTEEAFDTETEGAMLSRREPQDSDPAPRRRESMPPRPTSRSEPEPSSAPKAVYWTFGILAGTMLVSIMIAYAPKRPAPVLAVAPPKRQPPEMKGDWILRPLTLGRFALDTVANPDATEDEGEGTSFHVKCFSFHAPKVRLWFARGELSVGKGQYVPTGEWLALGAEDMASGRSLSQAECLGRLGAKQ